MLDVIVLIAMAITAVAFAAGLTVQAGLPLLPVLIGTAALFLVMAASFLMTRRGARHGATEGGERLDEIEEALEIIDSDLQRIDRLEDDLARLGNVSDKVERLDKAVSGGALGEQSGQATAALASELQTVYARIEALRADVEAENQNQRERIAADLGVLEGLIKQLSGNLTTPIPSATLAAPLHRETEPAPTVVAVEEEIVATMKSAPILEKEEAEAEPFSEPEPEPEPVIEREPLMAESEAETPPEAKLDEPESILTMEDAVEETSKVVEPSDAEPRSVETADLDAPAEAEPAEEAVAATRFTDHDDDDDDRMLDIIRVGIETGRVDLYLQPTVTLPERKVRYFEGLTRIRKADESLVMPGDYMPVAKRAALMPLIDNVLLVRSVQVLRRLGPDTRIKGIFGNVSMHSLLDPDYFPELIDFMEENANLSENLIFEISQAEMPGLTQAELGCLDTLGALGFTFCLDNVSDMEADFDALNERYFRFVKVSAESFLGGPSRKAADLKRQLDGLGMQLIIEKVEKDSDVADLLDHGIELAQGRLFGEPCPMNSALSRELENAGAF